MDLQPPIRYHITFNPDQIIEVIGPEGQGNFVAPVANPGTKFYVVLDGEVPIYVGATNQPIRSRLRAGFQANGNNGYRGYLWRHFLAEADIDVWLATVTDVDVESMVNDPIAQLPLADHARVLYVIIETVEAEVALLIRQEYDQWPRFQSEIHFHQTSDVLRQAAEQIFNHYR